MLLTGSICAQSASKKSLLEVGDRSFASKNYYDALIKYKEVLEFEPDNVEYLFKASEAARLHGAYQLAGIYLDSLWNKEDGKSTRKLDFIGDKLHRVDVIIKEPFPHIKFLFLKMEMMIHF